MPKPRASSYRLTPALVAAHCGGPVVCLATEGIGRSYQLHAERPSFDRSRDLRRRADVIGPDGTALDIAPIGPPAYAVVTIYGPLEQRAGYHDPCSGWTDGYDAIYERFESAFEESDVLLMIDSPGGSVCGLPECVEGILRLKEIKGRKVTTIINGMAGSAGYWIASAITDLGELYVTTSSMAGSIGARAAHVNEAGALTQAGVEITDFAYPPGKIALSPNRALSDVGKARGERDVMQAFDAFVAAVSSARPWLSRKAIVRLDADMLTGAKAVSAGLADAVASVEDVEARALSRAESEGESMKDEESKAPGAAENKGPPPDKEDEARAEGDGDSPEGRSCTKCGDGMPDAARYCAKCGTKAKAAEDEPEDEDAPESSKPGAMLARHQGSVASMLGLRPGASDAAIKAALSGKIAFVDHVVKALGASDEGTARGKLKATIEDARQGVAAAKEVRKLKADAEKRERLDLCLTLAKAGLPEFPRGNCVVDLVDDDGKPAGMKPGALFAHMPLAELRGFVAGKIENAGPVAKQERSPFDPPHEPSEDRAKANTKAANGTGPSPAQIEAAKGHPAVIAAASRPGAQPIDKIAAAFVAAGFAA